MMNNNCKPIPKIVRGNAFSIAVRVVARRLDGSVIEDFVLSKDDILNIVYGKTLTPTEFTITSSNMAVVHFDGTSDAGVYGIDFSGTFMSDPWRYSVPIIFEIVEFTTQGRMPKDGIIVEPTFEVAAEITFPVGKNETISSSNVYDNILGNSQDKLNQKFYKDFYFLGHFDVSSGGEDAAYDIATTQGQDAPTFMYYTITGNNRTALVFNHWLGTVEGNKKISQYLLLEGTVFCRTLELVNGAWTKPNWVRGIDGGLLRDSSISVSKIRSTDIDNTPTRDSNKFVRSGGVFDAINVLSEAAADYFNGGSYNRETHKIELKHDGVVKVQIDATDFIKDGMVSNVTVDSTHKTIIITFNTDAGKEDIEISVLDLFSNDSAAWKNAAVAGSGAWGRAGDTAVPTVAAVEEYTHAKNSVYTKTEADNKFVPVTAKTFTEAQKTQARTNIGAAASSDVYTKTESDNKFVDKTESIPTSNIIDETTGASQEELNADIINRVNSKQDTLVSGTNIKTINNQSVVGGGNINVGDKDITDKFYVVDSWGVNEISESSLPVSKLEAFYDSYNNSGKSLLILLTFGSSNSGYVVGNVISDRYFTIEFTYNNTYYKITRADTNQWSAITYQANGVVRYDITVNELTGGSISSDTMAKLNKLRADGYEDKMLAIRDGRTDIPFTVNAYGSSFEGYFITNVNNTLSLVTVTAGTVLPTTDWAATVTPLEKASNKVTSWQSTPDDTHYPSEKLVKDSIDDVDKLVEVKYGVATFAEVKALVDAGKIPYFYKDASDVSSVKFEYSGIVVHSNPTLHSLRFVAPAVTNVSNNVHNYKVLLQYDNTWSGVNDIPPEIIYNKVSTIIGKESRTDYYPSTKAVADYVTNAKKGIEGDIDLKYKSLNLVENEEEHFVVTPLGINYITETLNTAYILIDEGSSEKSYGSNYDPDLGWLYTVIFKTGSTPNISIQFDGVDDATNEIIYPDDFSIEANRLYELSIMYVGNDIITNVRTYLLRVADYEIPIINGGGSND